jgi:hypothetical protein
MNNWEKKKVQLFSIKINLKCILIYDSFDSGLVLRYLNIHVICSLYAIYFTFLFCRHVVPLGHIILIPREPVVALTGITRSRLEPTTYLTRCEKANHYTTDAVWNRRCSNSLMQQHRNVYSRHYSSHAIQVIKWYKFV